MRGGGRRRGVGTFSGGEVDVGEYGGNVAVFCEAWKDEVAEARIWE